MLRELDSRQIAEWIAYYGLEPFGEIAAEVRTGKVAAMIANTHLKKGAKPLTALDFVSPSFGVKESSSAKTPKKQSVEQQRAALTAWLGTSGRKTR